MLSLEAVADIVSSKLGTDLWSDPSRIDVLQACVSAAVGNAYELAELQRDTLGEMVRAVWVKWAKTQPDAKPSWLVEWADLPMRDKEVDRLIGEQLFMATLLSVAAFYGSPVNDAKKVPNA